MTKLHGARLANIPEAIHHPWGLSLSGSWSGAYGPHLTFLASVDIPANGQRGFVTQNYREQASGVEVLISAPDTDLNTRKQALRRMKRATRAAWVANLDAHQKQACFSHLPSVLDAILRNHCTVGGYAAVGDEADPQNILAQLADKEKEIALPWFADRGAGMEFRAYRLGDMLEKGPFSILQPRASARACAPRAILCPLVAFTRNGARLGQGGGHYDRYFAKNPHVMRIGLAWSIQEAEDIPMDRHDMPLHAILTERAWLDTGVIQHDG